MEKKALRSGAAERIYGQHSGFRKLKAYQVARLLFAQAHWLTERLMNRQVEDFEAGGGFSERLYKTRVNSRNRQNG